MAFFLNEDEKDDRGHPFINKCDYFLFCLPERTAYRKYKKRRIRHYRALPIHPFFCRKRIPLFRNQALRKDQRHHTAGSYRRKHR